MQALTDRDITIYGDGEQTRSFCYVDDLIGGLIKLMDTEDDFTGPINLGNPEEFMILDLAEKIIKLTGAKSSIKHERLPLDDPRQRQPDIGLAKKSLGWEPKIGLEKGLKRTIEYFENFSRGTHKA